MAICGMMATQGKAEEVVERGGRAGEQLEDGKAVELTQLSSNQMFTQSLSRGVGESELNPWFELPPS